MVVRKKKLKWSSYVGEYFFPREYLFPRKKVLPGVLISWEISTGEYIFTGVLFYGDTGCENARK